MDHLVIMRHFIICQIGHMLRIMAIVDRALLYMPLIAFKMHIDIIGKGYVVQWLRPKGLCLIDGAKKCMCMMLESTHTHMRLQGLEGVRANYPFHSCCQAVVWVSLNVSAGGIKVTQEPNFYRSFLTSRASGQELDP